jgi:hypothetical protein
MFLLTWYPLYDYEWRLVVGVREVLPKGVLPVGVLAAGEKKAGKMI